MHNLKSIFALLFVTVTFLAAAQPQKVNYQAVALTAGGQTVKNQAIKLRLSIVDSSATGTVLYTETHQPTTDGAGQFSVFLGGGTATVGNFSNILWSNGKDKFLKAEADVTGGTNYVLMGTSQIVSVPYALAAGSLTDSAKVISQDGTQWSLIVGPNGPNWQQSSGPSGLNMNYPCPGVPTVNYGGQTYNTVQIGNQCWFKENLNVGSMVQITSIQGNNNIIEKYCNSDNSSFCSIYGGLYQWGEAIQYQNGASNSTSPNPALTGIIKGICPTGWHLPNDNEWTILENYLGGSNIAAPALKSTSIWDPFSLAKGTNSSGFSALPGNSSMGTPGSHVYFWSSTQVNSTFAISRYLDQDFSNVLRSTDPKNYGFYVRCLKD